MWRTYSYRLTTELPRQVTAGAGFRVQFGRLRYRSKGDRNIITAFSQMPTSKSCLCFNEVIVID